MKHKGMQRPAEGRTLVGGDRIFKPVKAPGDLNGNGYEECGAHSRRSGKPCRNGAMNNGRCRMHGGTNTDPKPAYNGAKQWETAAITHGIYADVGLHDEEYPIYPGIIQQLGTLDEELNMARVKLRRCYRAQLHWEQVKDELSGALGDSGLYMQIALDNHILELDELNTKDGSVYVPSGEEGVPGEIKDVSTTRMRRKIHDYSLEIQQYTKLIRSLEATRVDLLAAGTGGEDYVRKLSEDLRDFQEGTTDSMPGGAEFGAGNYNDA
ncbi:hypothetical protein LCGC14_0799360 [marine sediment metagenome]|uniref:Uncharacterized protein n=1 Tax=marine sediment metagenome TaxID=412755 RepID=A0A0F9SA45_9ZZZZ